MMAGEPSVATKFMNGSIHFQETNTKGMQYTYDQLLTAHVTVLFAAAAQ
jgi:hypothetical protein